MKKAISEFVKPESVSDSIKKVKNYLGYDFGSSYNLIEHISENIHPDRPMSIHIKISNDEFDKVINFLETLDFKEYTYFSEDKKIKHVIKWTKYSDSYEKQYSTSYNKEIDYDIPFLIISMEIFLETKVLSYSETMI